MRSLSKCIAMGLLGYPTEFIHMTCLGLLANPKFTQKRLGYLGICILLDEKSEVLLLTSHTIKKDLDNPNQFIVAAALNSIGEIASPDMCRDTCGDVLKCLASSNPYIKKKAALALCKITKSCPELVDTVAGKLKLIFEDKNHGVLLSGLALAIQIFKTDPSYIKKNLKYVPHMIKYLKNLSTTNYAPDYDVNGITDPFLQARILEVLSYFGRAYHEDNDELTNLLGALPTNTDTSVKNTGNAVLYELVRTIFGYNSSSGLRTLASNILGKFLSNKDNNYKYIAMDSLQEIAKIDLPLVQKHKTMILEFLNDNDIAIKRKSLDLTYMIVNETNIKQIIKESLNFLNTSDNNDFKEELTEKIFYSLEKYSPSLKWEIDTLLKMLCISENHVNDSIIYKITNLIISATDLHQYSMFRFFVSMKVNPNQEGLLKVGIYLLGELCHLIIGVSANVEDNETVTITEEDIINLLVSFVNSKETSEICHEELVNCAFKLLGRLSVNGVNQLKSLLEQETRSFYCEVQERASEYIVFTQIANEQMQKKITDNIPVNKNAISEACEKSIIVNEFENDNEKNQYLNLIKVDGSTIVSKAQPFSSSQPISNPLFDLGGESKPVSSQPVQPNTQAKTINLLDDIGDIFSGGASTNPIPTTTVPSANPTDNLFNFLDMNQGTNPVPQTTEQAPTQSNPIDLLSQLGGMYNPPVQSQPVQPMPSMPIISQPQSQSVPNTMKEIYKNGDLSIYSMLTLSGDSYNGAFYISNNTSKKLTDVKLNFLVKKHITFKVNSTSGNILEPNASLGIKKEVSMKNNDISKPIVIKINLSYNSEGKEVSESAVINNI